MRRIFRFAAAAASILLLVTSQPGCGGGSSNTPTSGFDERVFVTIQSPSGGSLQIVDASKDQITGSTVTLNTPSTAGLGPISPSLMVPAANNTTLVFSNSDNIINVIDNIKEADIANLGATDCTASVTTCLLQMPGSTESIVETSDGKLIYAAIPSLSELAVVNTSPNPFTISPIPSTAGTCTPGQTCIPGPHELVLSHNNNKLLVFNETLNQMEVVNTADNTVQTVSAGLDHPAYGVFSSDDSKAYILNCGVECGGSQASVSVLDMTALTVGQTVPVDAATIGTSDATNLYVAGSNPATPGAGSVTILPLSSLSGGKQVKIGDGFHQVISIFQNKVLIGARTCTTGCLSILDPSAATAIVDAPKGDVTAVTGVTPRTVFYAAEGGEVRVYDVATGNEHLNNTAPVIDFSGNVTSVLYVGPKTK